MESEPAPDVHLPRPSALPVLGTAAEPAQGAAEGSYLDRSLCFQPEWPLAGRLLSAGQVLGDGVPRVSRAGICCSVRLCVLSLRMADCLSDRACCFRTDAWLLLCVTWSRESPSETLEKD